MCPTECPTPAEVPALLMCGSAMHWLHMLRSCPAGVLGEGPADAFNPDLLRDEPTEKVGVGEHFVRLCSALAG